MPILILQILIVVDSALGGPSAKVRLAAVQLTAALYPRLPVDVLGEHLASIVVPLFPLLEVSSSSSAVDAKPVVAVAARRPPLPAQTSESALSASTQAVSLRRTVTAATTVAVSSSSVLTISNINASPGCQDAEAETETELAGADLHAFGTLGRPFAPNFAPGESDLLSRVLDVMFAANKGRQWAAETQRLAVGIIKHLFIDMRENIQKYIQSVAYIPNVPELKTVFDLHQQEVRGLSLEQSLRLLCDMLSHASAHVRYVAVNRLTIACRENKEQLHRVLESTTNSSATTATEHIVSMMLQSLLRLCAHEQDGRVQAACARCFGELGAVDPSRVRVRLGKPPALPATEGKSGGDSAAFPWHVKLHDFGLYLLEHHLVPGLRSADRSATQDKSGFAIQGILRCISATYNEGEDVAAGGDEFVPSSTSMPEKLKDVLAAKSILDVTEPFWSTSYTIPETYNLRKPPLYFHGLPFMRWISLFTRFLIYKARGPLSPIFMACRGLIRLRTELCQYLLPHLIYDVLTQSGADQQQVDAPTRTLSTATNASAASATSVTSRAAAPRPAVDMVIEEVCLVLRGSSSSEAGNSQGTATSSMNTGSGASQSDQMCIQSIFSLFDTLSGWVTRCTQKSGYCFPRSPFQRGPSVYGCRSYEMEKNGIACVKAFLDAVPRDLLSKAALSIKAHTRALRYMEIHSREVQRQQHFYGVQLCAEGFLDYEALFKKCETDFAVKWRAADVSTTRSSAEFQKITILCGDHAGGELPILSAAQLESYTSIFTNLEDPDSLQGALVVSQIHGHPSNMWHRILELELTDDWLGALLEYGFVHNSQRFSNSLHHYIRRSAAQKAAAIAASGAAANATVGAAVGAVSVKVEHGSAMVVEGAEVELEQHQEQEQAGEGGELMSLDEVVELERRKLRCMVELGHFEAVIDQVGNNKKMLR